MFTQLTILLSLPLLNLLRLKKVAGEVSNGSEAANAVGVSRGGNRDGAGRASPEEEDGDGIDGGGEGLEIQVSSESEEIRDSYG